MTNKKNLLEQKLLVGILIAFILFIGLFFSFKTLAKIIQFDSPVQYKNETSAPLEPSEGMMYYDSNAGINKLFYYDGTDWKPIIASTQNASIIFDGLVQSTATGTSYFTGGNVGIGTADPGVNALKVYGDAEVTGTLTATLSGTYNGTISAINVSSGAFGSETGGGNYSFPGNVGIGVASPTAKLQVAQTITATGALKGIIYTGAVNTNQTLSTEIPSLTLTTAGRQWATGALTTQREILITQPTYSFVGASTITNAATVYITGAPIAGTNATITNNYALWVDAGEVRIDGDIGDTTNRVTKGWLTDLEITNDPTISGNAMATIYAGIGQNMYIGTTQVAINRASDTLNLAGIGTLGVGAITSSGLLDVTVASGYSATFMGGNVGIGTTGPGYKLDVAGSSGFTTINKIGPGSNNPERGPWNPIWSSIGAGRAVYADEEFALGANSVAVYNNSGGDGVQHFWEAGDGSQPNQSGKWIRIYNNGNATTPGWGGFYQNISARRNATFVQRFRAKLPVGYSLNIAENAQGTNNTSYWLTSTAGTGKWEEYIRVSHCGNTGTFSGGGHVYVSGGSSIFTWYLASCNLYEVDSPPGIFSGNVGIGDATPDVKLHIDNKGLTGLTDTAVYDVLKLSNTNAASATVPKGSNFTISLSRWENPGNNYPRTRVDFKTTGLTTDNNTTPNTIMSIRDDGKVGIGTASPGSKLVLKLSDNAGVDKLSILDSDGTEVAYINSDGKILASEIDPVYNIDGVSYATYGHSTTGLKEETVGKLRLQETRNKIQGTKFYTAEIDFDKQEIGSDLWLFKKITAFGNNWDDLVVSLSPEGKADVWYEFEVEENLLIIFGNNPVKVSYRLIAPRFDWPDRDTNLFEGGKANIGIKVE